MIGQEIAVSLLYDFKIGTEKIAEMMTHCTKK